MATPLPAFVLSQLTKLMRQGIPYRIALALAWTSRVDSVGTLDVLVIDGGSATAY